MESDETMPKNKISRRKTEKFPSDFGKQPLMPLEEERIEEFVLKDMLDPAFENSDGEGQFTLPKPRRDPPFDAW